MGSFNKYINGTDPHSAQQSYNYMQGLFSDGTPYVFNGFVTRFFNSGDPVRGIGDLDYSPSDRRLMMSCGPVNFLPGDSQQLVIKFAAAQGPDRLSSVSLLKSYLSGNYTPGLCDHATAEVSDYGHLVGVAFSPRSQQWLTGVPFGATFFNSGAGIGTQFFGSSLDPSSRPEFFPTVELRFSKSNHQSAFRYLRPGYNFGGYVDVPFTVWDVDHNIQLNAAFVEDEGSRVMDRTWDLDDSAHYGGREYLFIFRSAYSGTDSMNSAIKYPTRNLRDDANSLDILYGGWFSLAAGHSMADLNDGQKLVFAAQSLATNGPVDVLRFLPASLDLPSTRACALVCSTGVGIPFFTYQSSSPDIFRVGEDTVPTIKPVPRGVIGVVEVSSPAGPVNPPSGQDVWLKPNSTDDWLVMNSYSSLSNFNYGDLMGTNDWEIRFTSTGSDAYNRAGDKYTTRVPFEMWNVGDLSQGTPPVPRRLIVCVNDLDQSGGWTWGDRVYAVESAYQEPGPQSLPWVSDSIFLGGVIFQDVSHTAAAPATGTVVRFITAKNVLAAPMPSLAVESNFHSSQRAFNPRGQMDESRQRIKVTFTPPSKGAFSADLLVIDSLSGQVVKAVYMSGSGIAPCCSDHTGDINGSGAVDLADLTYLITYLTAGSARIGFPCPDAANLNNQGAIDLGDLTLLIGYLEGTYQLPLCSSRHVE